MSETNEERVSEFLSPDAPSDPRSLSREIWDFLKQNKKWWRAPIVLCLSLLGALVLLAGTPSAPFIYTLFWVESDCSRLARAVVRVRCNRRRP